MSVMMGDLKIRAFRSWDGDEIAVCGWMISPQSEAALQAPLLVEHEEGSRTEPFLRLTEDAARRFMDSLWECGIRPSQDVASTGQIEATKAHLEDLRKLVFKEFWEF